MAAVNAPNEEDFKSAFSNIHYTISDVQALEACAKLSKEFGINATTLASDYDLWISTRENSSCEVRATALTSAAFRKELVKARSSAKGGATKAGLTLFKQPFGSSWENYSETEPFQPTPKRQATDTHNVRGGAAHGLATTPVMTVRPPAGTPGGPAAVAGTLHSTPPGTITKFATRNNKGQVVSTLNEGVAAAVPRPAGSSLVGLRLLHEQLPPGGQHTFMMETLEAKVAATEERLSDWATWLRAALPADEGMDAGSASVAAVGQEPAWVVGRVVSDAAAEGGAASTTLGEAGVMLEGARDSADGARVRLDLTNLVAGPQAPGFRLFPGQAVAVKGLNPSGQVFVAQRLCTHMPPPAQAAVTAAHAPATFIIAAGPYTTTEDLSYEPLAELLRYCSEAAPDVLLLVGPFVDVDHPIVKSGNISVTYDQLFKDSVLARVSTWQAAHPASRVVLLPSARDAHHTPVFPTPPFALPGSTMCGAALAPVCSLQSPCTFEVATSSEGVATSGVVVGACAADVIKALSASELARAPTGVPPADRLASLAAHVVGQRTFFPLYPPPAGTCLDLSASAALALPVTPHLLLLPSDLNAFARVLPEAPAGSLTAGPGVQAAEAAAPPCIAVNPGRLVRGTAGGTFAAVTVQQGACPLSERVRVEIRRV